MIECSRIHSFVCWFRCLFACVRLVCSRVIVAAYLLSSLFAFSLVCWRVGWFVRLRVCLWCMCVCVCFAGWLLVLGLVCLFVFVCVLVHLFVFGLVDALAGLLACLCV